MSTHPGPSELHVHLVTRSEMAAMLEHLLYRANGKMRRVLIDRMPDAYWRLVQGTTAEDRSKTS